MSKVDIKDLAKRNVEAELIKFEERPYRAGQIFRWLYAKRARSFDEMTDLTGDLRSRLKDRFHIGRLGIADTRRSPSDGTTKYLLRLEDHNTVEAVFLPETRRNTICLSSQVGCKFACSFCASSPFGFVRNLRPGEILEEVLAVERENPEDRITNLVFMGIGEPFDNYDNVMAAIRVFNDPDAFGIGARKITLSTCGIIPGIEKLRKERLQIELSVSLHSADDKVRSRLVPINKKYPLKDLIAACRDYTVATKRIVTFEYILIKGVNSSRADAESLGRLLEGLDCKVNTILYNNVGAKGYEPATPADAKRFVAALEETGVKATHRRSRGDDIDAGCGQLRISRF